MGSYLIFIVPLIACHNYNLGLKKGFGINWINLAAISCVCMLIHSTPSLEKNLIKYTNNTFRPDRKASWMPGAGWNKKPNKTTQCYFKSRLECGGIRFDGSGVEKWPDTHSYLFRSGSFFILSLYLPLLLPLFPWLTHKQGCWSCPPLRSSNMQPGSWMIKAVAGGLHFETINRPPRAESNSKPSISVSPSPKWHRGRRCAEGERADSTSASSLYVVAKNVEQLWRNFGLSDVISSRHCGFIQLTSQPEGAAGGGWGWGFQTLIFNKQ